MCASTCRTFTLEVMIFPLMIMARWMIFYMAENPGAHNGARLYSGVGEKPLLAACLFCAEGCLGSC